MEELCAQRETPFLKKQDQKQQKTSTATSALHRNTHACTHTCLHTHACTHMNAHMHTHAFAQTHTHTHARTQTKHLKQEKSCECWVVVMGGVKKEKTRKIEKRTFLVRRPSRSKLILSNVQIHLFFPPSIAPGQMTCSPYSLGALKLRPTQHTLQYLYHSGQEGVSCLKALPSCKLPLWLAWAIPRGHTTGKWHLS